MKSLWSNLVARFEVWHDWLRAHPLLGEIYEIVDGSIGDYVRDHGLMYAAAVAFYALLSLIPLVVLFASASGFVLTYIAGSPDNAEFDALLNEVMNQLQVAVPYLDGTFKEDIRVIVENRRGLGIVGLIAVLIAASQVFRALEFSFARIFARSTHEEVDSSPQPRNVVVSKIIFGGFVTGMVSIFLVFRFVLATLAEMTQEIPWVADWAQDPLTSDSVLTRGLGGLIIIGGFTVVLRFFAGRRVKVRFALLGGLLFCLLFVMTEYFYDLYLERWSNFGTLYGPFSAIMVVVLWVYFVSTLVLICGQLVKTVQRRILHGPKWEKRWAGRTVTVARDPDESADG